MIDGEGGIRTHGTVPRTQHFQCCQFNHSCTSPNCGMWIAEFNLSSIPQSTFRILKPTGGEGGIRTHGGLSTTPVFESDLSPPLNKDLVRIARNSNNPRLSKH